MTNEFDEKCFQKEYEDFLKEENQLSPSKKVGAKALAFAREDLQPSHVIIMAKLVFLQLFMGLVTLLFCPQFNLSLTNNMELFHFFHRFFGEEICLALCGGIFMGAAAVVAAYTLKEPEARVIRRNKFLHFLLLSGISLAGLILWGADVYVSAIPYWVIGSVVFGAFLFQMNIIIKRSIIKRSVFSGQ